MVSVAQLAEHLTVAQRVAGSSPVTHPIKFAKQILEFGVKRSELRRKEILRNQDIF